MKNNLFVRVDVSSSIGTGHFFRCLALSQNLKSNFNEIIFLINKSSLKITKILEKNKFKFLYLSENLNNDKSIIEFFTNTLKDYSTHNNFILIDNYSIDFTMESHIRHLFQKIIVIDDLANRKHDCDLLIDQNYYENFENRYDFILSKNTVKLLGPKYAIIRDEFKEIPKKQFQTDSKIKNILISFGGVDPTNECTKALKSIMSLQFEDVQITIIAGMFNQNFFKLNETYQNYKNIRIFQHVDNLGELMSNADIFIGAGGTTTWERLYLGLPSMITIISENQHESVEFLSKQNQIINLGLAKNVSLSTYKKAITELNSEDLIQLSERNKQLIDGNGIQRIKKQIIELIND